MTANRRLLGLWPAAVLLSAACASPQGAGATGAQCYRIEDCQDGLVCVNSACTNQVNKIAGAPPMGATDAGAGVAVPTDARVVSPKDAAAAGGKAGAGGTPGSGGKPGSGGAPGSGGTQSSGGVPGTGGTPASGGTPSTGGAPSTGGTSGMPDGS